MDWKLNLVAPKCYWFFIWIYIFFTDNNFSLWAIRCVPLDCLISKIYKRYFLIKMLQSIVSNAICKSLRTILVRRSKSKGFVILSWRYDSQESVKWNFRNPDRKFIPWSWIICSIILETSCRSQMGLIFFGLVLRPFYTKT